MTLQTLMDLKGRTALVTGAAGNVGRIIAETLAECGCNLVLLDHPSLENPPWSKDLSMRSPGSIEWRRCDLESHEQRGTLLQSLRNQSTTINILINNAAFVGSTHLEGWNVPFEQQSLHTWRRAVEVNLTAVFHLSQALAPTLRTASGASIVNIASIYGMHGPDWRLYDGTSIGNPAAYAVSKGGLLQLTRWMATTLSPSVRVNAIVPGGILRNQPVEFIERYAARTPLARMATEDDLRGAIAYLATDMSAYVTGQVMCVDGGWGVW